jgi:hypothetical protein
MFDVVPLKAKARVNDCLCVAAINVHLCDMNRNVVIGQNMFLNFLNVHVFDWCLQPFKRSLTILNAVHHSCKQEIQLNDSQISLPIGRILIINSSG